MTGKVWYGMVRVRNASVRNVVGHHGAEWNGKVTYVWYGMVWYDMVWYGMVWYSMVWYSMVWYGMVWYGMVRYGLVRNGKLW